MVFGFGLEEKRLLCERCTPKLLPPPNRFAAASFTTNPKESSPINKDKSNVRTVLSFLIKSISIITEELAITARDKKFNKKISFLHISNKNSHHLIGLIPFFDIGFLIPEY